MDKKIFFVLLALIIVFSIGAIHAGDINSTALNSSDDDLQIDDSASFNGADSNADHLDESDKNQTEFVSPSDNVYYKGSYGVTLRDSTSSEGLSNKTVDFVINDVKYGAVTDDGGRANIDLTLSPGNYNVFISFGGDGDYGMCNLTHSFKILPTVKSNDVSKYYNAKTPYTAQFFDTKGNALANTVVSVSVNGKPYSVKTDGNGFARREMNLNPGTYKIVSTNPLMGYSITTNFVILSTISSSDVKQVQGQNKKFKARFFKSDGKPLAKTYVKYKLNGKTHKVKTNANGMISISLKKLKKGTFKIVCYNKDGLSKTNTIKIHGCNAIGISFSAVCLSVDLDFNDFTGI